MDSPHAPSQHAAPPPRELRPGAAAAAWLWPGLGHWVIGEKTRGMYIMAGVLFLFLFGLLVGGFDAVDRREDRLWFYAQALCGPIAFGADYVNQSYIKTRPEHRRNELEGLGRVNEMGTLFIALAGLMNLVVILDALHFHPKPNPSEPDPVPVPKRRMEDFTA